MNLMKSDPRHCRKCGAINSTIKHHPDVLDFKGLTVEVDSLAETVCNACGLTWVTPGQEIDNLQQLRSAFVDKRDEVRREEGLLEGHQIEYILKELNLTKAEAASLFGGGPNAFAKYIRGDVLQSTAMDRLLRLTMAFGTRAVQWLRQGSDAPLQRDAAWTVVQMQAEGHFFHKKALSASRFHAEVSLYSNFKVQVMTTGTAAPNVLKKLNIASWAKTDVPELSH